MQIIFFCRVLDIRVSEVVYPNLRQSRALEDAIEHILYAVRGDGTAVRRGEDVGVAGFLLLRFQHFHRAVAQGDRAVGVLRLERRLHDLAVDARDLSADAHRAAFPIHVLPFEPQQLAAAEAGRQLEVVHLVYAAVLRFVEERAELVGGERFHLLVLDLRERAAVGGIGQDQLLRDRLIHRGGDDLVDVPHRLGTEPFRLLFGLFADDAPIFEQVAVELLQVERGKLFERNAADAGLDVVRDVALIGLVGGRAHLDLGVVFKPDVHPLPDRVLSRFREVELRGVGERAFQLFLDLRLRFAEDVFADRLAGLGIVACRVAPLPAPVAALSDIALALCSAFCHIYHTPLKRTIL